MTHLGNLGIGTTNSSYLITINGAIGTNDVVVTNQFLSDYVFDPEYRLAPLSEVVAYIRAHHHLPDIPSDAEAREEGVNLGALQAKLWRRLRSSRFIFFRQPGSSRGNRDLQSSDREVSCFGGTALQIHSVDVSSDNLSLTIKQPLGNGWVQLAGLQSAGTNSSSVQASSSFPYAVAVSCTWDPTFRFPLFATDVSGDNQMITPSITTTWNLK